jgi:hypothetical protein
LGVIALALSGLYAAGYYGVEWVELELSDDGWKYCNGTKVRKWHLMHALSIANSHTPKLLHQ